MAEVTNPEPPDEWLRRTVSELTGLTDVRVEPTATYNWYVSSGTRSTIVLSGVVGERNVRELEKDLFRYSNWPRRS